MVKENPLIKCTDEFISGRNAMGQYSRNDCTKGSNCTKTLPEVIIIGASKCGTTALSLFLSYHPNTSINLPTKPEVKFFNKNYNRGMDWYLQELPCHTPATVVLEKSADYFYNAEVPERIWRMNQETKIVLVVCEPVKRIISEYFFKIDLGLLKNISIDHYLFVIKKGVRKLNTKWYPFRQSNYSFNFQRWQNVFPHKQIHVVSGDRLKTEPWVEMSALEKFLGFGRFFQRKQFVVNKTKGFYCVDIKSQNETQSCLGEDKGRRHPVVINTNVRKMMAEYFKPRKSFDW